MKNWPFIGVSSCSNRSYIFMNHVLCVLQCAIKFQNIYQTFYCVLLKNLWNFDIKVVAIIAKVSNCDVLSNWESQLSQLKFREIQLCQKKFKMKFVLLLSVLLGGALALPVAPDVGAVCSVVGDVAPQLQNLTNLLPSLLAPSKYFIDKNLKMGLFTAGWHILRRFIAIARLIFFILW